MSLQCGHAGERFDAQLAAKRSLSGVRPLMNNLVLSAGEDFPTKGASEPFRFRVELFMFPVRVLFLVRLLAESTLVLRDYGLIQNDFRCRDLDEVFPATWSLYFGVVLHPMTSKAAASVENFTARCTGEGPLVKVCLLVIVECVYLGVRLTAYIAHVRFKSQMGPFVS